MLLSSTVSDINIQLASKKDAVDWNQYVNAHPRSACIHRYETASVLQNSYPVSVKYLIARHEGKVCGVLPTYCKLTRLGLSNRYYSIKHALMADDLHISNALVQNLCRNAETAVVSSPNVMKIACLPARERVTLDLRLMPEVDAMWASLRSKTRNVIRKTQKNGLIFRKGTGLIDLFYTVYSKRMIAKNIPILSSDFFYNLMNAYEKDSEIYIAELNAKPVAAIWTLRHGCRLSYAYSAYMPGFETYSSIHFLLWEIMKDSIEQRLSSIDMGESTVGSGVYNFKIWMGAQPRETSLFSYSSKADSSSSIFQSIKERSMRVFVSYSPYFIRKKILTQRKINRALI